MAFGIIGRSNAELCFAVRLEIVYTVDSSASSGYRIVLYLQTPYSEWDLS